MAASNSLAARVLRWHAVHGRHDLPWTQNRTPYRVWLSEIMLQQTQVATVIPYFKNFMAEFADVHALAAAPADAVLHLWSGLGYYSRARNLHKTAQIIADDHNGEFPQEQSALEALPGIGRSTAAAIIALSWDRRATILDGNVKRVLARHFAVDGWPGNSAVMKQLWQLAEAEVPARGCRNYTQAMMDLGATLCTRRQPACAACPLSATCRGYGAGCAENFPAKRPPRKLPERHTRFLLIRNSEGAFLMTRRAPSGIWGGLWSFPECSGTDTVDAALARLGCVAPAVQKELVVLRHTFTHFHLHITPVVVSVDEVADTVREDDNLLWYHPQRPSRLGLPQPVTTLLKKFSTGRG